MISPAAALVTLCLVHVGVGGRDSRGESREQEVTGGGDRRRCLLHLLVELVQPLGLSADSGTEADRGEGAHLEVTSVLWQILDPASLRTAFELSVG